MGVRCSSVVRAFTHGAMGRRIDPSWGGPIELFLVPASVLLIIIIIRLFLWFLDHFSFVYVFLLFFLEKCRIQKCVNGGMFQRDLCKCNCSDNWSGDTCGRPTLNIISLVLLVVLFGLVFVWACFFSVCVWGGGGLWVFFCESKAWGGGGGMSGCFVFCVWFLFVLISN